MSIDPNKVYLNITKDVIEAVSACRDCECVIRDVEKREPHISELDHANRMRRRMNTWIRKNHSQRCPGVKLIMPTEKDYLDFGWGLSAEYIERRKAQDLVTEKKQKERMDELLHKHSRFEEPNANATA